MPDAKSHSEPSIEEIIASIGRGIAEDRHPSGTGETQQGGRASPAVREERDVLELTQVVDEDGSIRRIRARNPAPAENPAAADPRAAVPPNSIEAQGYGAGEP